jgi:hypothetical protein
VITITAEGLAAVRQHFFDMALRSRDLSPAWEEFLTWWAEMNKEQFSSRGARWRTPWKPLAPSTVRQKRNQGFLSESLVRTTSLRGELTRRPLGVEHIRAQEVTGGTSLSYAKFHQRGTKKMPARRLVNAEAVTREGAASSVIASWIIHGEPSTAGGLRLEG